MPDRRPRDIDLLLMLLTAGVAAMTLAVIAGAYFVLSHG